MSTKRRVGLGSARMRIQIAALFYILALTIGVIVMCAKSSTALFPASQAETSPPIKQVEIPDFEKDVSLIIESIDLYEEEQFIEDMDVEKSKIDRLKSEYPVAGEVYEYLNNQGWSDPVIAGVLGNMMAECGGQTLDLQWSIYGYDGSKYYGLCQWSLYYNPNVDGRDVAGQLDYLMGNIRTNMDYFGGSYDSFCAITDACDAARYFCNYYERGAGTSVRAANAIVAFDWIQGN